MTGRDSGTLRRIRGAVHTAVLPGARASLPPRATRALPAAREPLLTEFTREAGFLGTYLHGPLLPEQIPTAVVALLAEMEGRQYLAWDATTLPVPDVLSSLAAAGWERLAVEIPRTPEGRRSQVAELGRASVGLTGAVAGLADTGSIVVVSGPGRPRLASLLAPIHVVLLQVEALFPSLADYLQAQRATVELNSNLVVIAGPSRTADIELTLTVGVHGPKQLHVILIGTA